MTRLTQKKIKEHIKEYAKEYDGEPSYKAKNIAIDLAKDFINNAQLEFDKCLDANRKELNWDLFTDRLNIWEVALNELAQYFSFTNQQ